MAGMNWFRWHHGSVNDPKFQLVAKKAGCSVAVVIGVWATLLEAASMHANRGCHGDLDFEALDCSLGLDDGQSQQIYTLMTNRGLIDADAQRIAAWEKRQPAREDETANDRKRRQREREHDLQMQNVTEPESHDVTQCHAESRDVTQLSRDVTLEEIREEKIREDKEPPKPPADKSADSPREQKPEPPGFAKFWETWPANDRKQAKGKCLDAWKKAHAERDAALVIDHVLSLKNGSWARDGGQFVPAPLVYLNQRRWEGAQVFDIRTNDVFAGAI